MLRTNTVVDSARGNGIKKENISPDLRGGSNLMEDADAETKVTM